jgi:hypothetical protein
MSKTKVNRINKRHASRPKAADVETHEQQKKLESSSWTTWMGRTATFVPIAAVMLVAWPMLKNKQMKTNSWNETSVKPQQQRQQQTMKDCDLVMAESTIPDAGWGIYTLQDLQPGSDKLGGGGVVIPVPDLQQHHLNLGMGLLLHSYMWSSEITGGSTEGTVVYSLMPGIGTLSNGASNSYNVVPYQARQGHGGTSRDTSPGAGAGSYYQNFSFVPSKAIAAGGEIFIDYGRGWDTKISKTATIQRSTAWLRKNGMCVDHLRPGLSKIPNAGHGAFASRFLPEGSIVAPAPLLPIAHRYSLHFVSHDGGQRQQLLINYCWGHPNSTLLFLPYSPMVSLINHSGKRPNAVLRWSARESRMDFLSHEHIQTTVGLLMEVVATRDIHEGEEVLIDYGKRWEQAWERHVATWKMKQSVDNHSNYRYASEMNLIKHIRTEKEQQEEAPYPENLETSCYFHRDRAHVQSTSSSTTKFQWQHHRDLFHPSRLRPCRILERDITTHLYTVDIGNRQGLSQSDQVPSNQQWLVHGVPREAIQFTDKPYSSDQFLKHAFRHEIGIPNDQFPTHWMDRR